MPEARRLLRHVTPGLLFALETLLLLFVWDPQYARRLLSSLATPGAVGAVGAIAALLASGAVGFFLAMIHHLAYWHCPDYGEGGLRNSEKAVRDWIDTLIKVNEHAGRQKWVEDSESLTDHKHTLGTAFVGAVLSLPAMLLLLIPWPPQPLPAILLQCLAVLDPTRLWVACVVWVVWGGLCLLHLLSYLRARDIALGFDQKVIEGGPMDRADT